MKKLILLSILIIVGCEEPAIEGCLDGQATNYDATASIDNNTCTYVDSCGVIDIDKTNDCIQDDCGVWGGDGVDADSDDVCDDIDDCVVQAGVSQECGCNTGIASGKCDCDENTLDCLDVCGGSSVVDCAGVCGGTTTQEECAACELLDGTWDCAGVCNGSAVVDCAGDGDCAPASFVGDGWCDGEDQPFGYDLTCYDNDGGDCETTDGDDDDCYNVGYDDPCPTLDCCTYPYIKDCSCNGSCARVERLNDGGCDDGGISGNNLTCYNNDGGDCE